MRPPPDDDAQQVYARWLDHGTKLALAVSVIALFLYLSGALAPWVPLESLPRVWSLPVEQFLERTGAPSGWGWIRLAGYSDYLNYAGIALFALVSVPCLLRAIPCFLRRGERLQAALAAAQVLVLAAAASGIFTGGR
ncbi:MAG TPA: hypothetical protein VFB08_01445 [Burkholderiales bacterium]|nr:hypothetical protein [Burkholderiales bacterium]